MSEPSVRRFPARCWLLLLLGAALGAAERTASYDPASLAGLRPVPVMEGGRVMPFDTYARILLFRLHGMRSIRTRGPIREKIGPTAWALDVLRHRDQADAYLLFRIENRDLLDHLGLRLAGEALAEREHSGLVFVEYTLLEPHLERLMAEGRRVEAKPQGERDVLEQQVLDLAGNVIAYRSLRALGAGLTTDFARGKDAEPAALDVLLASREALLAAARDGLAGHRSGDGEAVAQARAVLDTLAAAERLANEAREPRPFPPDDAAIAAWATLGDIVRGGVFDGDRAPDPSQLEILRTWQAVARAPAASLPTAVTALAEVATAAATARNEHARLAAEVAYHRADLFYRSLIWFLLGLPLSLLPLLFERRRAILAWGAWGVTLVPVALVVAGIAWRCVLRERPPASTLYETILLVTAGAAATALVAELVTRRGLGTVAACVMGVVGVFIARRYEVFDGADTMPALVAVLDTNFWLATHVTTIVLGYAAGLLAGFLAHLHLGAVIVDALARLLAGRTVVGADWYRLTGRMVYGITCFAVLLSVVGTILGGIWANDSWGRFWGWDPKENGALLICLAQLMILHARLAGLIRAFGICVAAVLTNTVIAFSWWHVNLLGVGLHSYGFTGGIYGNLVLFYLIEWGFAAMALIATASLRFRRPMIGTG